MKLEELLQELDLRKALIVHFSHFANMRSGGVFPDDLLTAIANRRIWPLSCCVLWPGHKMKLPGQIGVVFRPTALNQIVSVSNDDSGSSFQSDGKDLSAGKALDEATLAETFAVTAGGYNEWRMKAADVIGIYVHATEGAGAKVQQPVFIDGVQVATDIAPRWFPIPEIRSYFPGRRLITMTPAGPADI